MKIGGSLLVMVATLLWCLRIRQEMLRRYRGYRDLQTVLLELNRNAKNQRLVFGQALLDASGVLGEDSPVGSITKEMAVNLEEGSLIKLWEAYIRRLSREMHFSAPLFTMLVRLSGVLGFTDGEGVSHYLMECVKATESEMTAYAKAYRSQLRVKAASAGMVGLMTVLVLW